MGDFVIQRHVNRNVTLIGGYKVFNFPTQNEREKIKDALTFDNPAYEKAKRYSRYVSRIDPILTYFEEDKKSITVPCGFDLNPFLDTKDIQYYDKRVDKKVDYPPFVLNLRETQEEARGAYLLLAGSRFGGKNIIQLPTGKGKTILGLALAYALGQRTLIIVHKVDLLNGWKKDIQKAFDGKVEPFILQGTKNVNFGKQITIATVQTLNRLSKEDFEMLTSKFGFIIQDEMHHCPASSYATTLYFKAKYRLGLTATPERADGLDHIMNLYYGGICYKYESKGDEKDILPVNIFDVSVPEVYFDPIVSQKRSGVWYCESQKDLDAPQSAVLQRGQKRLSTLPFDKRPREISSYSFIDDRVVCSSNVFQKVKDVLTSEYQQGHSVVVFFTQKTHIDWYREHLTPLFGEDLLTYYGDNSEQQNAQNLEKAEKQRRTITLATYAKATEGTNVKQWEVELLVSSINNAKNVEQAVGRIRRVAKEKINPVRVYDFNYPNCFMLNNHVYKRRERYRKLHFTGAVDCVKPQKQRKIFNRNS